MIGASTAGKIASAHLQDMLDGRDARKPDSNEVGDVAERLFEDTLVKAKRVKLTVSEGFNFGVRFGVAVGYAAGHLNAESAQECIREAFEDTEVRMGQLVEYVADDLKLKSAS